MENETNNNFNGNRNKIININKDVIISENDIQDNQKKVIAKSIRDHTGFYNFTNLDSLNGFLYVKDTINQIKYSR